MKHEATLQVPACWKELIKVEFPEDLVGITSEKQCTGIDDPKPHYDDDRCVHFAFSDGMVFALSLLSGQHNYYGKFWWAKKLSSFQLQEMETFDSEYHYFCFGDEYHVKINWIP